MGGFLLVSAGKLNFASLSKSLGSGVSGRSRDPELGSRVFRDPDEVD